MRIYMDNAATTPMDPRVKKAMDPFFCEQFGNPSSIHNFGQEAKDAIEKARAQVAQVLKAKPEEIIFTSGGTEADNTAIISIGYALHKKGNHIITSSIEHHAILHACEFMASQGFNITYLPVSNEGIISPDDLKNAITDKTILISIMHANNEVGSIQPIRKIGTLARDRGILFHTDAVQTFGHLHIDVNEMPIDLLSLSAHKFYGPKGVGALYLRKGTPFIPFMHGGAQEQGRRSSTYNVPGIVGLGKASAIAIEEMKREHEQIKSLRDELLENIMNRIEKIHLNGHREMRLPNNINLSFEGVEGESLLMNLDLEGIAASSGSACSSGSSDPSHVLLALGLSKEHARGSLRLTLGRFTSRKDTDQVLNVLIKVLKHLRSLSAFE
jgi:cysteine desulfurase